MIQPHLHLVDTEGKPVNPATGAAVTQAYRWVVREFPLIDTALIANWAELVACSMRARNATVRDAKQYAFAALRGKVLDWLRTSTGKLEHVGIGSDLERLSNVQGSPQEQMDRRVLFEQLKAILNDRDQVILVLLLDGTSDGEIGLALGITPAAARKAIQRMKERILAQLGSGRSKDETGHASQDLCETKGYGR